MEGTPEKPKEELEEILAERPREKYVKNFFAGATEAVLEERDELETLATKDPLTGLDNRRGFEEKARALVSQLNDQTKARKEGVLHHLSFAMLDIDHFKAINDTYGHKAGDDVLKAVAEKLKEFVRAADVVARTGGEEFTLLFPGATPEEVLTKKFGAEPGKNEDAHLEIEVIIEGKLVKVRMSGGITEYQRGPGESIETAADRADKALYYSKATGRNKIVEFSEALGKANGA